MSKARDVALDELHNVMGTYSTQLQACTPRDAQQKYRAHSITGERGEVKPRGSLSLQAPADAQAAGAAAGAAGATAAGGQGKTAAGGSNQASSKSSSKSSSPTGSKFNVVWELAHAFLPRVRVSP